MKKRHILVDICDNPTAEREADLSRSCVRDKAEDTVPTYTTGLMMIRLRRLRRNTVGPNTPGVYQN